MIEMAIRITKFREHKEGTLVGFVNILLTSLGLEFKDAAIHKKDRPRWLSIRCKSRRNQQRAARLSRYFRFDEGAYGAFEAEILAALDEYLIQHDQTAPEVATDDIQF
jgi:hypothetical protein